MKRLLVVGATVAGLALVVPTAQAHRPTPSAAARPDVAVGTFTRNLLGASLFRQTGTSVTVDGRYARLRPGQAYFTVIYGNGNCDPAQAFPVGPFTANRFGFGALDTTVSAPMAGLVKGTMSVSVRVGDNASDQDGDGLTGPTDVVAVAGQPGIGLVECDGTPFVR